MSRRAHIIGRNHRNEMPSRIVFYDTETVSETTTETSEEHTAKVICAEFCTQRNKTTPHSIRPETYHRSEDFWNAVDAFCVQKKKTYVVAHNQHFDALASKAFVLLPTLGWELATDIIDSNIFFVLMKKNSRTLVLLDSTNLFRSSIAEMGEQIALPKLAVDFCEVSEADLEKYCQRDVEILRRYFFSYLTFLQENDLGNFRITTAGQAFSAYTHRFMCHDIFVHTNERAIQMEREAFRGGITDCFTLGKKIGKFAKLDYNSAYPYILKNKALPTKLLGVFERVSVESLKRAMEDKVVIAKVLVDTTKRCVAIRRGRLILPTGRFWATLTSPEIEFIQKRGKILAVESMAVYESAVIFGDYVNFFYHRRLHLKDTGNKTEEAHCKSFLNNLWGRFGMRYRRRLVMPGFASDSYEECVVRRSATDETFSEFSYAGKCVRESKEWTEGNDTFVAIPAFTTAYGRVKLLADIEKIGWNSVHYSDTDSIICDSLSLEKSGIRISNTRLGALKLEGEADHIVITAPKHYSFGGEIKIKGIKKSDRKIAEHCYETTVFSKTRTAIRAGKIDRVVITRRKKVLSALYKKGLVSPSGRTIPFHLSEQSAH